MNESRQRRRLVTFLGTGKYETTCYSRGRGRGIATPYVANAIARLCEADKVIVLATQKAGEVHCQGLTSALQGDPAWSGQLEFKRIPDGRTESELWQQFTVLLDAMGGDDELLLDITHGFRSQPFFAAGALVYLRMLGSLEERRVSVLYGRYLPEEKERSPIWDLTPFLDLLDWAHGAALLIQTGHAGPLIEVADRTDKNVRRQLATSGHREFPPTSQLVGALRNFADDLATVRIASLLTGYEQDDRYKGKATGSAALLMKAIESCAMDARAHLPALGPVLERMEEVAKDLPTKSLAGDSGKRAMGGLAKRYLRFSRYPEAAIVLREAMVSQYASGTEAVEVNSSKFGSEARRSAEKSWKEKDNNSRSVASVRNDIEHGGFNKQPLAAKKLKDRVKELINDFF